MNNYRRLEIAMVLVAAGLVILLAGNASAKGIVGLQTSVGAGYHRAFTLDDNGLDTRLGIDLKLGPVGLGLVGRFGSDRLDGDGVLRGAGYFNVTLFLPTPVVVPYLQLGAGVSSFRPDIGSASGSRMAFHQGIGVDILIPKHLAIGLFVDVDENVDRDSRDTEAGLSGLVMLKFRI